MRSFKIISEFKNGNDWALFKVNKSSGDIIGI